MNAESWVSAATIWRRIDVPLVPTRLRTQPFLTALLSKPRLFQTGAIPMPASRFLCEHLHQNLFWACTSRIHAQVPVVTTGELTEALRQQIPRSIDVTVMAGPAFRAAPLPFI